MLVEFRIKNFRSLRDEQVLSLVASTDKTLLDTHALDTGLKAAPHLLKCAVVYGANASGKSNLIKALQYMRDVVLVSAALQPGQPFDRLHPFKLDATSGNLPTEFEVTFILEGVRYQYGFTMNPQRVVSEQLLVYKAFKPQRWFERHFDAESGKYVYEFGPSLKGAKNLWEGATRPNALFLSMAVQLNSEALRPVFDWFSNRLVIFNEQSPLSPQFSVQMLKQEAQRKAICEFLRAADISIADIEVATKQAMVHSIRFDLATGKREEEAGEQAVDEIKFHHLTEHGMAVFDLMDESSGTRNCWCRRWCACSTGLKSTPAARNSSSPRTIPRCSMPTACSDAIKSVLLKSARIKVQHCIRCSTSARARVKRWSVGTYKGDTVRCRSCIIRL